MAELTYSNALRMDAYLTDILVGLDPALDAALAEQHDNGLPDIEVSPLAGKLLHLLVRISGARRVLEIGTLGAFSTIWMARALPPDGQIVTIEAEPEIARIAQGNLERAGVDQLVHIRLGRAEHVLPALTDELPFDLVFIDADKESNTLYLDWAARLGHPGTVVVVDNVGRSGDVADSEQVSSQILGVRAGLEMLRDDPRFDATAVQTIDRKGWDGFAVALVR